MLKPGNTDYNSENMKQEETGTYICCHLSSSCITNVRDSLGWRPREFPQKYMLSISISTNVGSTIKTKICFESIR